MVAEQLASRLKTLAILGLALASSSVAAVTIAVDANAGRIPINPAIYGKNDGVSDAPSKPTTDSLINLDKSVGVKLLRLSGGNNSTKYQWRKKLSSHPDWYNNVYAHDWDFSAQEVQNKLPGVQGLFTLQVLGWAASNTTNNWGDWAWAQAHGGSYPPAGLDLAGGGTTDGTNLLTKGNPNLYLERWPADSAVGILPHWFGAGGVGLDTNRFRYWNMDNEPEIWNGTHSDVVTDTMVIDTFINRYITVAKAARAKWPGITLVGPVFANEWQWWNWNNHTLDIGGVKYSNMEYFIKKVGAAEASSGKRLLDVWDMHFYPGYNDASKVTDLLQIHRLFYDTTYKWPGSNGIHAIDGQWGTAVANYTYLRIERWMNQYLGAGRGRSAMTEFGAASGSGNASVNAVAYASMLGTFANNKFELFTPWDWYPGWYETMHLFTTYAKSTRVKSTSTLDTLVSAYSSLNAGGDSLTVILVNRDQNNAQSTSVSLANFVTTLTSAQTRQLANLTGETFKSGTQNAVVSGTVPIANNAFTISLPKLSVTAVVLASSSTPVATEVHQQVKPFLAATASRQQLHLTLHGATDAQVANLVDMHGRTVQSWAIPSGVSEHHLPLNGASTGTYFVQVPGYGQQAVVVMP